MSDVATYWPLLVAQYLLVCLIMGIPTMVLIAWLREAEKGKK